MTGSRAGGKGRVVWTAGAEYEVELVAALAESLVGLVVVRKVTRIFSMRRGTWCTLGICTCCSVLFVYTSLHTGRNCCQTHQVVGTPL